MFKDDDDPSPINPNLGFFQFDKKEIQTCLYIYSDEMGESFGLIQCFRDVERKVGGVISNTIPTRNSANKRGYDSQRNLIKAYNHVRDITMNRPRFKLVWEGNANLGFKTFYLKTSYEMEESLNLCQN